MLQTAEDEAVSPVIAVILMVAITVVLAATVYVWVSGFSASGSQAKSLSLSQVAAVTSTSPVSFTVVSISPNFACNGLKVTDSTTTASGPYTAGGASYSITDGGSCTATAMAAGDTINLNWGANTAPKAGDALNFIDTSSNTIVATVTLH